MNAPHPLLGTLDLFKYRAANEREALDSAIHTIQFACKNPSIADVKRAVNAAQCMADQLPEELRGQADLEDAFAMVELKLDALHIPAEETLDDEASDREDDARADRDREAS